MLTAPHTEKTVASLVFEPLDAIYPRSLNRYRCHGLNDLDFAQLGVRRVLSHAKSGQEFLQLHADLGGQDIEPSLFFKSLKSPRRLANLRSLNHLLGSSLSRQPEDPFAAFEALDTFAIYAGDGHYQKAACFDPKASQPGEKTLASGHFFSLNLRSHHLDYLDLSSPQDGKKKEHDVSVLKRLEAQTLRRAAPPGPQVIYAWDKACIDDRFWHTLKSQHGVSFLTREKANSAAEILSADQLDPCDPLNEGLQSDHRVGRPNGVMLRRLVYRDPRDESTDPLLTNELSLPAPLLVLIYKARWDIEKAFDQLKSKMNERKSWASSSCAKKAHALFEGLAHNLTLLFEDSIRSQEGLRDEREPKKAAIRARTRTNRAGRLMGEGVNFVNGAISRASQRTQRFIRWLRVGIYRAAPWEPARARLAQIWGCVS